MCALLQLWHRVAHTLPRTGRIFSEPSNRVVDSMLSRASVYPRFADLSLRDTKCYTIAPRSRGGEYKWTSHVSRDRVGYK